MDKKLLRFHTTIQGRVPTKEALAIFEQHSDGLIYAMEEAMLELASCETFSETQTVYVEDNLWYLQIYHKKRWAFLFFLSLPGNTIVFLNGYAKRANKIPSLSKTQLRHAKYLAKGVQYA